MKKKFLLPLLSLVILLGSCKKEPMHIEDCAYLHDTQNVTEINKKELLDRLGMGDNKALLAVLPDKVLRVVTLRYWTEDPQGKPILASGIVTYAISHPSFQTMGAILGVHFTIGSNQEAPSVRKATHESMMALFGYVVVAPDYIGYGETVNSVHPYHHAQNTGQVSVDLMMAAREYFATQNNRFPRTLTIMGYSEGGYASLACLKYLQQEYPGWIHVKQVFAGAGAYDLIGSYKTFIKTNYSSQPVTIPMLMLGLNYADNLNLKIDKIFKGKLLDNYQKWILSKKYTTDKITKEIGSTDIRDFLAKEVFDENDENTKKFIGSLEKNGLVKDWKPSVPVVLLHGTDDTIVPYVNSENAYKYFRSIGCDVMLHPIQGKDHKPAGNDFYLYCLLRLVTSSKNVDNVASSSEDYQPFIDYMQNTKESLFNL